MIGVKGMQSAFAVWVRGCVRRRRSGGGGGNRYYFLDCLNVSGPSTLQYRRPDKVSSRMLRIQVA